jgi:hypothetical protein
MTDNVLQIWPEILAVVSGVVVLFLFALTLGLPHRPKVLPGSSGHRDGDDTAEHEEINPDGYIDHFAGVIEEAGGSLPPILKVAIPGILIWWLLYLILNWTPK